MARVRLLWLSWRMCNQKDVTGAISHACTGAHCVGLSKCEEDAVLGLVQCKGTSWETLDTYLCVEEKTAPRRCTHFIKCNAVTTETFRKISRRTSRTGSIGACFQGHSDPQQGNWSDLIPGYSGFLACLGNCLFEGMIHCFSMD